MSLSDKAILASLSISTWAARKLDKPATAKVETEFSTQGKVGQYTKNLLPGARELQEVGRVATSIREFYYTNTLPWCADGTRILSSKNYLPFTSEYRKRRGEFDRAVSDFLTAYPSLQAHAQVKLGSLFSPGEYPAIARLESSFSCDVQFMPMPDVQDFRVEILDSEKTEFLDRMKDAESRAMRDCWSRLHEVVSRAAGKLSQPDAIFRDSLIENISEVCAILPRLNLTDDPQLETMRQHVEQTIAAISPDSCRVSESSRNSAAGSLADIASKMSAFMGAI